MSEGKRNILFVTPTDASSREVERKRKKERRGDSDCCSDTIINPAFFYLSFYPLACCCCSTAEQASLLTQGISDSSNLSQRNCSFTGLLSRCYGTMINICLLPVWKLAAFYINVAGVRLRWLKFTFGR